MGKGEVRVQNWMRWVLSAKCMPDPIYYFPAHSEPFLSKELHRFGSDETCRWAKSVLKDV